LWRWGYGMPLVGLQYALSLPPNNDYPFDSDSLQFADSIIFLAGSSSKGTVVFVCKPVVSNSWSANHVSSSARVCRLSLVDFTNRGKFPYLAVALSDSSLAVWTYKAALSTNAFKDKALTRVLFPLCRLDYQAVQVSLKQTETDEDHNGETDGKLERNLFFLEFLL
jgi:hypothetical protein